MDSSIKMHERLHQVFSLGRNLHFPAKPLTPYHFYLVLFPQALALVQNLNLTKITFELGQSFIS